MKTVASPLITEKERENRVSTIELDPSPRLICGDYDLMLRTESTDSGFEYRVLCTKLNIH